MAIFVKYMLTEKFGNFRVSRTSSTARTGRTSGISSWRTNTPTFTSLRLNSTAALVFKTPTTCQMTTSSIVLSITSPQTGPPVYRRSAIPQTKSPYLHPRSSQRRRSSCASTRAPFSTSSLLDGVCRTRLLDSLGSGRHCLASWYVVGILFELCGPFLILHLRRSSFRSTLSQPRA